MNNPATYNNGRRAGTLLGWDPLRLFDDLVGETVWSAYPSPVSVQTDDDGAKISVDMPGVDPADLELTFEAGRLAIRGKRGERTYAFDVPLGDKIDPDRIEAELDKGVLTVVAHAKPEAKPRKIQIKPGHGAKSLGSGEHK